MGDFRDKLEKEALSAAFELAYGKIGKDRQKGVLDIFKLAEGLIKKGNPDADFSFIEREIMAEDGLAMGYIDRCFDNLAKKVLKTWILNLGYDALYKGTKEIKEAAAQYGITIPKLIIFDDPKGMSFREMDRIVGEALNLGIHGFIISGKEPLENPGELMDLANRHSEALFMAFTEGNLITESLAKELKGALNLALVLKSSGNWTKPMSYLKEEGLLFGTLVEYDEENCMTYFSDDFIEMEKELGVMFSAYSKSKAGDEGINSEIQVKTEMGDFIKERINKIRNLRNKEGLLVVDLEKDNQFIGGHISGGRDFLTIKSQEEIEGKSLIDYLKVK